MFTNITRRMTIGLGLALVVGSLIVADAESARAQANARPATTNQTVVPATYNQMGGHGMMGVTSGQNGHQAPRHGQASAQYHGGSWHGGQGQGHGGPCW
jgi:hypothetical protein